MIEFCSLAGDLKKRLTLVFASGNFQRQDLNFNFAFQLFVVRQETIAQLVSQDSLQQPIAADIQSGSTGHEVFCLPVGKQLISYQLRCQLDRFIRVSV